jgi:hypothetical protein
VQPVHDHVGVLWKVSVDATSESRRDGFHVVSLRIG